MSLKTLYYRLREVDTPVLLVVKDDKGFVSINKRPLMSKIERKHCLISTSYLAGSFDILIFFHI